MSKAQWKFKISLVHGNLPNRESQGSFIVFLVGENCSCNFIKLAVKKFKTCSTKFINFKDSCYD